MEAAGLPNHAPITFFGVFKPPGMTVGKAHIDIREKFVSISLLWRRKLYT
jgi:hypothetical protein